MKTIFHLGMIAFLGLSISSCSKSGSDLVTNSGAQVTNSAQKSSSLPATTQITTSKIRGHYGSNHNDFVFDAIQIYPSIIQPYPEPLGNSDSYLHPGDVAVFFVTISPDYADQVMTNPFLNAVDDATGQVVNTYQLNTYVNSPFAAVQLPSDLAGQPVMYAVVNIDNSFNLTTISLHAEATFTNNTGVADLSHAFSITP